MSPAELLGIAATIADAAARLAALVASGAVDPDELLTVAVAATVAGCSVRELGAARRAGVLAMYGRQRTRTVRRSDLATWIATRRAPVVAGVDDLDMQRRMSRLRAAKKLTT